MKKTLLFFGVNIVILFVVLISCKDKNKRIKELVVYKINYTYDNIGICDSTMQLINHYVFNRDSIITKYTDNESGYFYLADYNKKNRTLIKKFYSSDTSFLYSSMSELNRNGLETSIKFFDSVKNCTYTILKFYNEKSSLIQKEQNLFSDGSMNQTIYEYDKYNNLIKIYSCNRQDSTIKEFHKIIYDNIGRVITDTIYYSDGRKIIERKYKENKMVSQIEKYDKKNDSGYTPLSVEEAYWKKYYFYDKHNNIIEERNIKILPHSNSFYLESRIETRYTKNHLVSQKTLYNSKNHKVYTISMEYEF